ncbi:hypothetical protein LX32DRAFT_409070 [Colletotrichum zoysiae]|uniref:ATP-grasp domain-containing protein n=1 Tax=Colletotrichum zoysiae TaxID=1216348 RepID=A0AAD9HG29_9PEZI|nr:hypothetical protein LX32DRAFT_409070 [Colletotrichum zoysiae]
MHICTLQLPDGGSVACEWRLSKPWNTLCALLTVDLFITTPGKSSSNLGPNLLNLNRDAPITEFIQDQLQIASSGGSGSVALKLIVPVEGGYVIRSDLLEFRLHGCLLVGRAAGFLEPRQHVLGFLSQSFNGDADTLLGAFETAIGAVEARTRADETLSDTMQRLEDELRNRLSLDWFLPEPIPARRLAIVKPTRDMLGFAALKNMGFSLVILDDPGSWLADDDGPHADIRETFIPFDTNPDSGFRNRLKAAVGPECVDGIIAATRSEGLFAAIADVCQELGLPTEPPEAFRNGTDKYAQRRLVDGDARAFRFAGVEQLQAQLDAGLVLPDYPLVVKPTTLGGLSQCVSRVSNQEELFEAVDKIKRRVFGHDVSVPIVSEALVEPYEGGPEVDVNLVLCDGELLFCEISDDFPSAADRDGATMADDFQETMFLYPSKLPQAEQEALRVELHKAVLQLGFTSGVFHVEARVRNSSMRYAERPDGDHELVERSASADPPAGPPSVFLIEVNARPPGYIGLMTIAYTYGVDYYALWGLNAVGDAARFRAMARPFLDGPQYTSALVLVMPDRGGTLVSEDPAPALRRCRPDLMESVPLCREVFSKGDQVPDPTGPWNTFTSCIMVISRSGREELLRTVKMIREEWKLEIV